MFLQITKNLSLCVIMLSILGLAGCRCCKWSNCAYRAVDHVNETKLTLDNWYRPQWDISRAGMPDWCESDLNRRLCPCRCNGGPCRACPVYYPSEYTTKYRQQMLAEANAAQMNTSMPLPQEELPQPQPTK